MAIVPAHPASRSGSHNVVQFPHSRKMTTWTVSPDGAAEFSSISDALAVARDGDTIALDAGMYLESVTVDKAVHLVGPVDPRFAIDECDPESDDVSYAMIVGTGDQVVHWTATGGSMQNIFITRADDMEETTSTLARIQSGGVRLERCVLDRGAHCAISCRESEVELARCHIRNTPVGICVLDSNVALERMHVEVTEITSLHLEAGSTAALVDCSFEGRTVLRGATTAFTGNDFDTLFLHEPMVTRGNRISSLVQVYDFQSDAAAMVGI